MAVLDDIVFPKGGIEAKAPGSVDAVQVLVNLAGDLAG
jgi:hypothetical protein